MKVLTIAIPSYNVEKYLEKTLTSFVDKELLDSLEVLIINDGSSDRTEDIANEFVRKYPQAFKLINKENGGHGSAVNAGIKNSTAQYFKIVDGDDWVETKNLIELVKQLNRLENKPDLVLTDYQTVDMNTGKINKILFKNLEYCKMYTVAEILETNQLFPMATVCYKSSILKDNEITLQEKTFYVDEEYDVFPFMFVDSIYVSDMLIYNYLIGNINQSIHIDNQIKRLEDKKKVARRLSEFLFKKHNNSDNYKYCFKKVKGLIESIFLLGFIYHPNKKNGKKEAVTFYEEIQKLNPYLSKAVKIKFNFFLFLNFFKNRKKYYQLLSKN